MIKTLILYVRYARGESVTFLMLSYLEKMSTRAEKILSIETMIR